MAWLLLVADSVMRAIFLCLLSACANEPACEDCFGYVQVSWVVDGARACPADGVVAITITSHDRPDITPSSPCDSFSTSPLYFEGGLHDLSVELRVGTQTMARGERFGVQFPILGSTQELQFDLMR